MVHDEVRFYVVRAVMLDLQNRPPVDGPSGQGYDIEPACLADGAGQQHAGEGVESNADRVGGRVYGQFNAAHGRSQLCRSFVVMDLSLMALGTGAMVAASLITSPVLRVAGLYPKFLEEGKSVQKSSGKKHVRLTALVRLSLGLTGLALFGVGTFPDDYLEVPHRICTFAVVGGSVATLGMLWWLWRKPRPKTARGLLALAVVSVVGAVGFIVSSDVPGLFERLAVYGFIAGIFIMGIALTNGAHQPSSDEYV